MKFDFDRHFDRHNTYSGEWDMTDEMLRFYGMGEKMPENAICLSTADMDFECAPCIRTALQKVVDFNSYGYCMLDPSMAPDYYNSIISWNKRRHGWEIKADEITYVNGTIEAIKLTLLSLTKPGDGVIITPPVYSPFASVISLVGRKAVKCHLLNNNGYYTMDWQAFEAAVKNPATTAFLLCSPHNPVGRIWTDEELVRMYDICTANGVLVIADEIHGDLIRKDAEFHPLATLVDGMNLVVCTGANKTFNIAALHASHTIIKNPEIREKFRTQTGMISPSPFVIHAVISAYNEGEEWLDQLRDYLDQNIDFAIDYIHQYLPKVTVYRPQGTYVIWLDFRAYGLTGEELHDRVLNKAGLMLEEGELFDAEEGCGFIRICLATQKSILKEALERLSAQFES